MTETIGVFQAPESEAWFHEPAFKTRFDKVDRWMRKYLVDFADQDDTGRLLLSMDYQCDMPLHDDVTVDAATRSMKAMFDRGWSLLTEGCPVAFAEIQNRPGYYIFQLSSPIRAVVAKVDDRMFFLALDSVLLTELYAKIEAHKLALSLARSYEVKR